MGLGQEAGFLVRYPVRRKQPRVQVENLRFQSSLTARATLGGAEAARAWGDTTRAVGAFRVSSWQAEMCGIKGTAWKLSH